MSGAGHAGSPCLVRVVFAGVFQQTCDKGRVTSRRATFARTIRAICPQVETDLPRPGGRAMACAAAKENDGCDTRKR
ncbi:hypothetical protein Ga0080559_TMP2996 [Salipiger profundus]|uniref:Uncharacterized protein n=1 Tax=Salipiger profundus TaxID=1229727 RepID=A0A1U7D6Q7_9RHOB|nr:hypothetical protein Ga0080559_TMP2996 [Salipiger profundus]